MYADRYLSGKRDTAARELDAQSLFVHGFEEAQTKNAVHFERCPDDTVSQIVELDAGLCSPRILGDPCILAVHSLPSTPPSKQLLISSLLSLSDDA
jgi:hypothetical protein